jgi:hypothetical protein
MAMVSIATIPPHRSLLKLQQFTINNTQLRTRNMLKKAHIFGVIAAALAIAPGTAFAGQVAGSNNTVNQGSVTRGVGNVTGQSANSTNIQNQVKKGGWWSGGSQTAGANSGVNQGSDTYGAGNVTGQSANNHNIQNQYSGRKFRRY